jgi:hypothetical protein
MDAKTAKTNIALSFMLEAFEWEMGMELIDEE